MTPDERIERLRGYARYAKPGVWGNYPDEDILAALAELDRLRQERDAAHDALRSLAFTLGVGGYNADAVDAAVFEKKIRDGIDLLLAPVSAELDRLRQERERP